MTMLIGGNMQCELCRDKEAVIIRRSAMNLCADCKKLENRQVRRYRSAERAKLAAKANNK